MAPLEVVAAWRATLLVGLGVSMLLGTPIFAVLAGTGLVLFLTSGGPLAAVPTEIYDIVSSPLLPTIPLFTLAGTLLARGSTPARLVAVFQEAAGWLPGGAAVATVLVCAFFTSFTGASAVTILALGGLLYPVLIQNGFTPAFAVGLLTAVRKHRPPVPSEPAGDPLRRRGTHADRPDVPGGNAARPRDGCAGVPLLHARRMARGRALAPRCIPGPCSGRCGRPARRWSCPSSSW